MNKTYKLIAGVCIAAIGLLISKQTTAQTTTSKIPFQGSLYDQGTPVNGTNEMVFSITAASWTETQSVQVVNGLYSVVLGSITPLPANLFTGVDSQQLAITVAGTSIGIVAIYPPFITPEVVRQNMPDSIFASFNNDAPEHSTLDVSINGTGTGSNAAIKAVANTDGNNRAIKGLSINPTSTGSNMGVMGLAEGQGKYNHGIYGHSAGSGNGDEGPNFGEGSINFGVEGNATGNAWSNTGIEGSNYGSVGKFNYGVSGISNAGTAASENTGVRGLAYGEGANRGIYGSANGGTENWAGWFDGDVMITGNLISSSAVPLQVMNGSGEIRAEIGLFNDGGSIKAYGSGGSNAAILGTRASNDAQGFLGLYNSSGVAGINMKVQDRLDGSNNVIGEMGYLGLYNDVDGSSTEFSGEGLIRMKNPNGNMAATLRLNAQGGGMLYTYNDFGSNTGWFGNFQDQGGFSQLAGYDGAGNITGAVLNGFWDGSSNARFMLEDENARQLVSVNIDEGTGGKAGTLFTYGPNTPNLEMRGKGWENNDLPTIQMFGQHTDGGSWYHSNARLEVNSDGSNNWGYISLSNSTDAGANNNTVEIYGDDGRITLRSADGSAEVTIDAYNGITGVPANSNFNNLDISDPNIMGGQGFAFINIANDSGGSDPSGYSGELYLQGKNTPNVQLGGKPWEDNNLPFMSLFGSTPDGGGWFQSNLNMSVETDGTDEWASLALHKTNIIGETQETTINLDGQNGNISSNNLLSNSYSLNNGKVSIGSGNNGNGDFGQFDMHSPTGANNRISIGFADVGEEAGFISIWKDNGGGPGEYALMNVQSGGPGGAVFGSLNLNDDLGNSVSLNGYGDINATGNINGTGISAAGNITGVNIDATGVLFSADGTVQTSDRRFKKNIQTIENALENTLKLRGVSYAWKDKNKSQRNQIGVIAQEVEEVYPEFVHTKEDGYKAVNYAQMTAILIEAVKELNAKVEALEGENSELKAELTKVDLLEQKIKRFEELLTGGKDKLFSLTASN